MDRTIEKSTKPAPKFYIGELLKALLVPKKIPLVIYLLADSLFIFLGLMIIFPILGIQFSENENVTFVCIALLSVAIYVGTIVLALSPLGEWFLRRKYKCNAVESAGMKSRIERLFDVYMPRQSWQTRTFLRRSNCIISRMTSPMPSQLAETQFALLPAFLHIPTMRSEAFWAMNLDICPIRIRISPCWCLSPICLSMSCSFLRRFSF